MQIEEIHIETIVCQRMLILQTFLTPLPQSVRTQAAQPQATTTRAQPPQSQLPSQTPSPSRPEASQEVRRASQGTTNESRRPAGREAQVKARKKNNSRI